MQFILCFFFLLVKEQVLSRPECGCKNLRPCYERMIDELKHGDEVACVEAAAIGSSTIEVYLRALQDFCGDVITVKEDKSTFEGRTLFEVILEPVSATPAKNTANKITTPAKKPSNQTTTPAKKTPNKTTTAAQKTTTPAQKTTTPAKKTTTPAKKTTTRAKKTTAPAKKTTAPATKTPNKTTKEKMRRSGKGKPVILLEAGQLAGTESVGLAMYFIEQLVGCEENAEMINNVRWVVLPCTNPDGMEYAKNLRSDWHKNQMIFIDKPGTGVDISRNFDYKFNDCPENKEPISATYPGEQPNSEFETEFITDVIKRYLPDLKAYISIRRNGHSVLYPFAGSDTDIPDNAHSKRAAEMMTQKANHKVVTVQQFENMSIYDMNGERQCGSSVDYAHSKRVKIALEMRVFLGEDNAITSMFQSLPRGYEATLRHVYSMALKELYNIIVNKLLEAQPPPAAHNKPLPAAHIKGQIKAQN